MATQENPCAASSLLSGLLDGPEVSLREVASTRLSVHYETGDPELPVLSVCTSAAVLLPNSLVTDALPRQATSPPRTGDLTSEVVIGRGGRLRSPEASWKVRRWWQPPRPVGLPRPPAPALAASVPQVRLPGVPTPSPSYGGLSPASLVGAGPGLTPAGDDVLAGALVTAHATDDARLRSWQDATRRQLRRGRTTAVSHAMLHHALDGYSTPELAAFLTAICLGEDVTATRTALLTVGHSSGSALLTGVLHTLSTQHLEGAA